MTFRSLRILPFSVAAAMAVSVVATACREEDPVRTVANPGAIPTMVTTDVDTYISDSGYVKYHAVTDIWEMYDDTVNPFWRFPHPLIIDIYAPGMKPDAHIECDSAHYQTQRQLFRFDGNVTAVNTQKDTFLTQQLYWDQANKTFYTDSFIHIVKSDRVVEGYGFTSNDKMTRYNINRPTAIIPASELTKGREGGNNASGAAADTTFTSGGGPSFHAAPVPASVRNRENDERLEAKHENVIRPSTGRPPGDTSPGLKRR